MQKIFIYQFRKYLQENFNNFIYKLKKLCKNTNSLLMDQIKPYETLLYMSTLLKFLIQKLNQHYLKFLL